MTTRNQDIKYQQTHQMIRFTHLGLIIKQLTKSYRDFWELGMRRLISKKKGEAVKQELHHVRQYVGLRLPVSLSI